MGTQPEKLDEALYSRQLYVLGHEAQRRLMGSDVLIVGLDGLGVEVAKNVILSGVKSVTLLDNTLVSVADLGAQFYLSPSDVGRGRAESCVERLADLNRYVKVSHTADEALLNSAKIADGTYKVVVLCNQPQSLQLSISSFTHAHSISLLVGSTRGVLGEVFVDLVKHHVSDPDDLQTKRGLITHISNNGIVTVHEDARHSLQTGDFVTFEDVKGMSALNGSPARPIKVLSPFSFSIEGTENLPPYEGSQGYFQQVKQALDLEFAPLSACIAQPRIINDFGNGMPLHIVNQALYAYREKHGRYPAPDTWDDAQQVLTIAKQMASERKAEVDDKFIVRVSRCAGAVINPMCAFLGGVLGQEVIKACSGKHTPIVQQLYFEAASALPDDSTDVKEFSPASSRYDAQLAVFGRSLHQAVTQHRLFLVGAGAIGCEMLKNWALMGVSTNGGRITITDMDTIEKSNLNRQFLFRNTDVGQLKSDAAAREAHKMNPDVNIVAHANRVGKASEDIYDDAFWENLTGVVTALDNVDARLYVDERCIYYQKPLVDSGTLGTKGNTQVVVPFLTESYGSSRDAPEESIPICTLKHFPNKIEHTIQWARDAFEGHFKQAPEEVNGYLTNPSYLADNAKQPNSAITNLKTVLDYLVKERPLTFEQCVHWARKLFEEEYHNKIVQLLTVFPPDSLTSSGTPFWSGPKRAPVPIKFSSNDETHMEFIEAAANLHAFNYGLKGDSDRASLLMHLSTCVLPAFQPNKNAKIAANDAEQKALNEKQMEEDDLDAQINALSGDLPSAASLAGYRLNAAEFEKDDDTNFHIAFINACSNLRARNYAIKEVTRHETKFIGGKIIPAIATTTALVTGLVCLEMMKVLQKKKIEDYACAYVNLATNEFSFFEPLPPKFITADLKEGPWKWSLWDRIEVDARGLSLKQFIDHVEDKLGLQISMLSYGNSLIYNQFGMGNKKKIAERLQMPIGGAIETVAKVELADKTRYVILEACVNDDDDNEIDIPFIRCRIRD